MANPQPTDPHLRVAHSINEAIMLRDFSKRQRKILDLVLRLSWGCGKKTACIPRQRDFMIVGIAESHISTELRWLVESKVINIDSCEYYFNKDFDQWQVSRVKPFSPDKLTELVRLNINGTSQNGKLLNDGLTKTVSKNFPKQEVGTSQNSKFATPELATAKENDRNIKKDNIYTYRDKRRKIRDDDPDKFSKGKYAHMVVRTHEDLEELKPELAKRIKGAKGPE